VVHDNSVGQKVRLVNDHKWLLVKFTKKWPFLTN